MTRSNAAQILFIKSITGFDILRNIKGTSAFNGFFFSDSGAIANLAK